MLHIHITCIWNSFFYSSFLFCSAWCQPSSGNISKCAFMPISHTTRHFAHPLLFSSIFELFFLISTHTILSTSHKNRTQYFFYPSRRMEIDMLMHMMHIWICFVCIHAIVKLFLCTVDAAFNRIYVCAYVCTFLDSIPTFFFVSIFYWD